MSTITIPIEARFLTFQIEEFRIEERTIDVGGRPQQRRERVRSLRDVPHGHRVSQLSPAIQYANRVFQPADIRFLLVSSVDLSVPALGGAEHVDDAGFHILSRQFPGRACVSLMLVSSFHRGELGGRSLESAGTCIIQAMGQQMMNRVLCHELGHLLELGHAGPGNVDHYNLMYPALRAGDRLDCPTG